MRMAALDVCSKITCSPPYECVRSCPELTCDDDCAEESSQKTTHTSIDRRRNNMVLLQPLVQEDPLEEEMAAHCILASRILWTEEPGGLRSMGSQRVGHDLAIADMFTQ